MLDVRGLFRAETERVSGKEGEKENSGKVPHIGQNIVICLGAEQSQL